MKSSNYICPNEVGNYRVFGPVRVCVSLCVCPCVCLSVRLMRFSAALAVRGTILGSMVGYGTIDFGVNRCILKVKGYKNIAFTISGHSSSLWIDIKIVLF